MYSEYRSRIKEYAGYAKSNSKYRCDLWSIGIAQSSMDSETPTDDMLSTAVIAVAAKRSYILASSFNGNVNSTHVMISLYITPTYLPAPTYLLR